MATRAALLLAAAALAAPTRAATPAATLEACVDKPYKSFDCAKQTLWGNCTKPEWAGYCDDTCGRCPASYALVPGSLAPAGAGAATAKAVPRTTTQAAFGADLPELDVTLEQVTPSVARVKIGAPGRWEVPRALLRNTVPPTPADATDAPAFDLQTQADPFAFRVTRAGEAAPLFDTAGRRFVFKDQYIEFGTSLPPSARLYGLGESTSTTGMLLPRDGKPHTLWNHDSPSAYPGPNMYGSWPVLMDVRPDGRAHGVLLMNSNGMDVTLTDDALTFRVIGGVIDLYLLAGPTPMDVMDQVTALIGRPWLPPYWSLGLMQSKYGYQSVEEFEEAVDGYAKASIPLETFVADSQYMDGDQDFTLDPKKFPQAKMAAFVSKLHANGQKFVPILDPVIHVRKGYAPYDSGMAAGVFVRDQTGAPYVAQLWPGASHLPDFMHPGAGKWWQDQLASMGADGVAPDGIWLDMNEVSNYCTGDVCKATRKIPPNNKFVCELSCEAGPNALGKKTNPPLPAGLYNPPYAINNGEDETPLGTKTLPVTARHHGGVLEYDAHNLYGHVQSLVTADALTALTGKRQFIFTRSSFLGTGAVAAHWTGDTASTWDDMRASLPMVFQAGLAGIPFVGADICGFMKYASEELCSRWAALGAWYPYSRNHHADGYQEFWRWPKVAATARTAYAWRYRALPHMYTAFADARERGCPIARPLLFGWPADANLTNRYEQFTIGDGLLVSPVLKGGRAGTDAYFPAGVWYGLVDGGTVDASAGGAWATLASAMTDPAPVHLAGGAIVPLGAGGMTTAAARAAPLTVVAALPRPASPVWARCGAAPPAPRPGSLAATGSMFLDDGESVEDGPPGAGHRVSFALSVDDDAAAGAFNGSFLLSWPKASASGGCANVSWPMLDEVRVLGVAPVRAASVRAAAVDRSTGAKTKLTPKYVSFDDKAGALTVGGLKHALRCGVDVAITFSGAGTGAGRVRGAPTVSPLPFDPACDCDDVSPTPDYTCPQQAAYGKCADGFMYGFCKKSCALCKCDTEAGTPAPAAKKAGQFSQ